MLIGLVDHIEVAPPGDLRPRLAAGGQTDQRELGALIVGPNEALESRVRPLWAHNADFLRQNNHPERDDGVDCAASLEVHSTPVFALVLGSHWLQLELGRLGLHIEAGSS